MIPKPLTWYWYSWRMSGQEMKWWRCMAMTRAPLCAELSRAATACSSRAVIPLAVTLLAVTLLAVTPLVVTPLVVTPLAVTPLASAAPWRM